MRAHIRESSRSRTLRRDIFADTAHVGQRCSYVIRSRRDAVARTR